MAETTQDTSMTIADKREVIMNVTGVGHNTVAGLTDAQVKVAYEAIRRDVEKTSPATPITTNRYKGGPVQKRPQMMHGGVYKGKKHAYAAGGYVNNLKMMKK